jgi:hypothetical protein
METRRCGGPAFRRGRGSTICALVRDWLVSDVPPNVVQRIMGHEDVTTTLNIYTDVPADYVDRVDGVFDESVMTEGRWTSPRTRKTPPRRGHKLRKDVVGVTGFEPAASSSRIMAPHRSGLREYKICRSAAPIAMR